MDELIQAYSETDFKVYDPAIVIKVGEVNPELNQLLSVNNCTEWAYITAWNPYSEVTSKELNEQRNLQLRNDLDKYLVFDGEGEGSDPAWEPEKSFLILGIDRNTTIEIGKKYKQNAIVLGVFNQPAELLWIKA